MKKSIVTVLGMSVLGVGMLASQASAVESAACSEYSNNWFGSNGTAAVYSQCNFAGGTSTSWGVAVAQGLSGEITPGVKGVLSDLVSTAWVPNTWYVYASAIGRNSSGQSISGCRADDESTEQGQSGVDGDGCQNGATYKLFVRLTQ